MTGAAVATIAEMCWQLSSRELKFHILSMRPMICPLLRSLARRHCRRAAMLCSPCQAIEYQQRGCEAVDEKE
jgi:hypothetical protein